MGRLQASYNITNKQVLEATKLTDAYDTAVSKLQPGETINETSSARATRENAQYVLLQMDNLILLATNSIRSLRAQTSFSTFKEYKENYTNSYANTLTQKTRDNVNTKLQEEKNSKRNQ